MTTRPTLSNVLPAKGAAARFEPLPEDPPATLPTAETVPPDPDATALSKRAGKPSRTALTVKVTDAVYARLREAAHRLEVDKQDLVDRALDELLSKLGF